MSGWREWKWIIEWHTPTIGVIHGIKKILFAGKTKYQAVEVVETYDYGKALFLDGKIQSSEYDEALYHEALVHPSMTAHPNPEDVLIIGGGEGATLREVLRHKSVKSVVMVDLDGEVVDICRKYLPEWSRGAFEDLRAELVIGDGREYLANTDKEFDVVIVDATDPLEGGPSVLLYTYEFYKLVKKRLRRKGVVVTQATTPYLYETIYATIYNTMSSVFNIARTYYTVIPSFHGSWGFVLGSDEIDPSKLSAMEVDKILEERVEGDLFSYDGQTHVRMFTLPKNIRRILEKYGNLIATDSKPITTP